MKPRRFEVHPGAAEIPEDVLAWARAKSDEHEREWGLGEEDVGILYPLCGTRGPVGQHVDVEVNAGDLIIGLILEGTHDLGGAEGDLLPLAPGTVYILDPHVEHGTFAQPDDRLLFVVAAVYEEDVSPDPTILAKYLLRLTRKAMAVHG